MATDDGRTITITGEFIEDSHAKGAFLTILSNSSAEIIYLVLKRIGLNRFFSGMIALPPSNYTVFVYDLEENHLPNNHPANLVPDYVLIKDARKFFSIK